MKWRREKNEVLADGQVNSVQSQLFHINHSSPLFLLLSSLQLNINLGEFIIKYRYACVLIKKPILSLKHVHCLSDAYCTKNSKLSWFGKLQSDWLTLCNCTFISPSRSKISGWYYKHFWGWNIHWVCQCLQSYTIYNIYYFVFRLRVCLHSKDVLKTEKFLFDFGKVLHTDDNIVRKNHSHTDPRKRLKRCVIHARPVDGDDTL